MESDDFIVSQCPNKHCKTQVKEHWRTSDGRWVIGQCKKQNAAHGQCYANRVVKGVPEKSRITRTALLAQLQKSAKKKSVMKATTKKTATKATTKKKTATKAATKKKSVVKAGATKVKKRNGRKAPPKKR